MNYMAEIAKLEKKNRYEKKDILNSKFEMFRNDKISIYYAPHNEYINKKARIVIVGITPGWTQTEIAYRTAKKMLDAKENMDTLYRKCKVEARFAGTMRTNLIKMLDKLELNTYLEIETCKNLFDDNCELLHTTSLIRYPVFLKGKNYSGNSPSILKDEVLYEYVTRYFVPEIRQFEKNCIIIPLGKAVESVLYNLCGEQIISEQQCLFGFPHPSGLNVHREPQFIENKEKLALKIYSLFGKI